MPWLRVSDLLDLKEGRSRVRPRRNPLAYLLALFCPGARYGIFGVAVTVYLVAILTGIALPAFAKARQKVQAVRQHQQAIYQNEDAGG